MSYVVSTYLYGAFYSVCHIRVLEWINTPKLSECQVTLCSKQAAYLKVNEQCRFTLKAAFICHRKKAILKCRTILKIMKYTYATIFTPIYFLFLQTQFPFQKFRIPLKIQFQNKDWVFLADCSKRNCLEWCLIVGNLKYNLRLILSKFLLFDQCKLHIYSECVSWSAWNNVWLWEIFNLISVLSCRNFFCLISTNSIFVANVLAEVLEMMPDCLKS